MTLLRCLWKFLQGKKTAITNSIQILLWYLYITKHIGTYEAMAISGILAAFGITANIGNFVIEKKAKKDA